MPIRRQPYQRLSSPPPIRLTSRDKQILEAIYSFDGMLGLRQIDRLFFSGKGRSQPRSRMRALFDNGFVQMPSVESIHQVPLGETVYWLDSKGASLVGGLQGQTLPQFKWRRKPRFSQIAHDLRINDFRIAVREACRLRPDLYLETWIPESEFSSQPDRISFETSVGKRTSRTIRPDGYFQIQQQVQSGRSKPFAFLLEIDMGSEDNPRFAREKVLPGVAYLKSSKYATRFGQPYGRYLVVTSSERRMRNMKAQTERNGGRGLFYFSTFTDLDTGSLLTNPVWLLAGQAEQRSIIPTKP